MLAAVAIALALLVLTSSAFVFKKAGRSPWLAIVPFYNQWVTYEIAGSPPKWCLSYNLPIVLLYGIGSIARHNGKTTGVETALLGILAVITMVGVYLYAITCMRLAERFKHSRMFGFVLIFLISPVGWPILAFSDDKYKKTNPKSDFKPKKFKKEME